jgi:hypothetical protein
MTYVPDVAKYWGRYASGWGLQQERCSLINARLEAPLAMSKSAGAPQREAGAK